MNRSSLLLIGVAGLLIVSGGQYETSGQALEFLTASGFEGGHLVRHAQYIPPRTFDRGSCDFSCRDRYGGPSTWTGDRSQGGNIDYSRCASQCDIRYWDYQERSRKELEKARP